MALTDIICRGAKPGDKPYKLTDSQELYLLGHTRWQILTL